MGSKSLYQDFVNSYALMHDCYDGQSQNRTLGNVLCWTQLCYLGLCSCTICTMVRYIFFSFITVSCATTKIMHDYRETVLSAHSLFKLLTLTLIFMLDTIAAIFPICLHNLSTSTSLLCSPSYCFSCIHAHAHLVSVIGTCVIEHSVYF